MIGWAKYYKKGCCVTGNMEELYVMFSEDVFGLKQCAGVHRLGIGQKGPTRRSG